MPVLTLLVAALSGIMLVLWGQKPDAIPIYVPLSGFMLAYVVWLAARISVFLRTFIAMYAVGFLLIASTATLRAFGFVPQQLLPFLAPIFMATASAVFAVIVYLISRLSVIGTITTIADRYFLSQEPVGNAYGGFGRLFGTEGRAAIAMLCVIIAGNFVQVALTIRLNLWYRDLFDALEKKDQSAFWEQIWWVFVPLLVVWIIFQMIDLITDEMFQIRWRTFLTHHYFDRWLSNSTHYRISLIPGATDNPDQRVAVDVNQFIARTMALSVRLLTQAATLVSFTVILWGLSKDFTFPGSEWVVPGFLVWVALAYALVGTVITHLIGRPLIRLDFLQERVEANFRFSLARLREYGEQVALLEGGPAERASLRSRFAEVVTNFIRILIRRLKLIGFTFSWQQISVAFPYILMGPYFFLQKISLGQLQQGAAAFGRVEGALSFFITSYQSLAAYKAVLDRLSTFDQAMRTAETSGKAEAAVASGTDRDGNIHVQDLALSLPDGRRIVEAPALDFARGRRTLLTGPSGSGKSTLFRALAGIWPYAEGRIGVPAGAHVMMLPQRPYLPQGTLRNAVSYPQPHDAFTDAEVSAALAAVRLDKLVGSLDMDDNWQQRLSGGEQQRLAVARALLAKPDWLLLDESTSALDEPNEALIYETLRKVLPDTSIISIGHRSTLAAFHDDKVDLKPGDGDIFTPVRV